MGGGCSLCLLVLETPFSPVYNHSSVLPLVSEAAVNHSFTCHMTESCTMIPQLLSPDLVSE